MKTEQPPQQPLISYQDSLCNIIKVGDLEIQSPYESIDILLEKVKHLLRDRAVKEYLSILKNQKINNLKYFG